MASEVRHLFSWETQYSADSAEFCPVEPYLNYLAVGTYQLADAEQPSGGESSTSKEDIPKKRLGRLYLKLMLEERLVLIQQTEMPAILDMKWCRHKIQGKPILAIANAAGQLLLYVLDSANEAEVELKFFCGCELDEEDALALSLDWSSWKVPSEMPLISVSDSKGKISVFILNDKELTLQERFPAHDFEAWITAFNYWTPNLVYTGGDDCKFRGFDMRVHPACATFTSRTHNAGVTSIHSNANREHELASGSYDEVVNVWDMRNMRTPRASVSLGGGIWRLKWEPHGKDLLLAACMHNGYHIVDTSASDLRTVASFTEHESLAYGVDWWSGACNAKHIVASASFYDHLLCLWEFTIK